MVCKSWGSTRNGTGSNDLGSDTLKVVEKTGDYSPVQGRGRALLCERPAIPCDLLQTLQAVGFAEKSVLIREGHLLVQRQDRCFLHVY